MSNEGVGEQGVSRKLGRIATEDAFGERLRVLVARSGEKVTDVAKSLGIRREELYEIFDSVRHARAAWLEFLPPAVEKLYLTERAAALGFSLTPTADASSPNARMHVVVKELTDVLRVGALAEADDDHSVEEAIEERREIEEAQRALAARDAHLASVIEKRGVRLMRGAR